MNFNIVLIVMQMQIHSVHLHLRRHWLNAKLDARCEQTLRLYVRAQVNPLQKYYLYIFCKVFHSVHKDHTTVTKKVYI